MASNGNPGDSRPTEALLTGDDLPPVVIINPLGESSLLLIGDHAGNAIPAALGDLGVSAEDRARHIGWDIGIAALGQALADALDAVFVRQTYSRLVIDCNRAPEAPDAMPSVSDDTPIPGNAALDTAARARRVAAIHAPYHDAIAAQLAARDAAGAATILVALHSFTPKMKDAPGAIRPWEVGILHDRGDTRFAHACLDWLRAESGLTIGDNEPYRMDLIDYTIPRHAYPARRPYVEIEVRQDLLGDDAGIASMATLLARMLRAAAAI